MHLRTHNTQFHKVITNINDYTQIYNEICPLINYPTVNDTNNVLILYALPSFIPLHNTNLQAFSLFVRPTSLVYNLIKWKLS